MLSSTKANVIKLGGGTAISQACNFLIIPILARIYSPQDLGVYAIFVSLKSIFLVLSTGSYENAILAEKKHRCLPLLFILISILSFLLSVVVFFACTLARLYEIKLVPSMLFATCLAVSIFLGGLNQGSYYLLNRLEKYGYMSFVELITVLPFGLFAIFIGTFKATPGGLLCSSVIAQIIVSVYMLWRLAFCKIFDHYHFSLKRITFIGYKHIDFPKYLIVSSFIDRFCAQSLTIFAGGFFNDAAAGVILLVQKTISIPAKLLGNSISTVYKQKACNYLIETGSCYSLFIKTFRYLSIVSIPILLVFLLLSPQIFLKVYGPDWSMAGFYAQILAIPSVLSFVISPLSAVLLLKGNQKIDFFLQVSLALMLLLYSTLISGLSISQFLIGYSIIYTAKYSLELFFSYRASLGYTAS